MDEWNNLPIEDNSVSAESNVLAEKHPKKKKKFRFIHVFLLLILLVVITIATVGILFWMDFSASDRLASATSLTVEPGASTAVIANQLEEQGLIDHPLFFRVYARFTEADGTWQAGSFDLSADMGYEALIAALQTPVLREAVDVTIPPQFTVEQIATTLEEKGVCSATSFIDAVKNGVFDYDFVKAIPTDNGRVYRLEGYLVPDTYKFHTNSNAQDVVERMLENFNNKLTDDLRQQISDRGWTIDQAIIFASMVEGEAASQEDMEKVSRVLANRLEPDSGFAQLQLCSTRDYVNELNADVNAADYNTYLREGLPIGPINNPGLQALTAALNPSNDDDIRSCYFFATDYSTGITYFSRTLAEHNAVIEKYGIHDLG